MKLNHRWTALRSLVLVGLVAGTVAGCNEAEPAEPTPAPLGTLSTIPNMRAEDVSSDGKYVLSTDMTSAAVDFYIYDVASGTNTLGGSAGDWMQDFATGISNGRRVSALYGNNPVQGGLWDQATGWLGLGNVYPAGCEIDDVTHAEAQSAAWDIDSAGHVAVGLLWNGCQAVAMRWTDADGAGHFVELDLLGTGSPDPDTAGVFGPPNNRATAIADNGTVAAGWASDTATVEGLGLFGIDRRPAIWQANGAGTLIMAPGIGTPDAPGEFFDISADGSTAVGEYAQKPILWTAASGVVDLAPGNNQGKAQAVALNGQLVFGTYNTIDPLDPFNNGPATPFVWTQSGGLKSFADLAAANGITIPAGYTWTAFAGASADGTVVAATVSDEMWRPVTLVMQMPVSVYGL